MYALTSDMAKHIYSGYKSGRWTVISEDAVTVKSIKNYWCVCECGSKRLVAVKALRSMRSKSCGCLVGDTCRRVMKRHGLTRTRIYKVWANMKTRCFNKSNLHYNRYGARGITVCDEWIKFSGFAKWALENGYSDSLTIDRINNDGNYEPGNCRWSTLTEQANNRGKTIYLSAFGETKSAQDWIRDSRCVVCRTTLITRLLHKWDHEKALTLKPKTHAN